MSADREMTMAEVGDYSEDEEPQQRSRHSRPAASQWGRTTRGFKSGLKLTKGFTQTTVPAAARKMTYSKLGKKDRATPTRLDKLRGNTPTTSYDAAVDDLINVILNAKKDITRIDGLDDYENAKEYAAKRGLRVSDQETDVNHDGVNDVILYDRSGKPVIVNGYKLSPSKQPLRKLYHKAKRTGALDDPEAGYRGYVKQLYGAGEWQADGTREVTYDKNNLPDELKELKLKGWRIPTAPKKSQPMHQRVMNLIKDEFEKFCDDAFEDRMWIKGALPRFKIFTLVYILAVEKEMWDSLGADKQQVAEEAERINQLSGVEGDAVTIYDAYKARKELNKKGYNETLRENWKNIMETNFQEVIGAILSDIGFSDEFMKTLHTDEQIKRELSDEELQAFNITKKRLIEDWKTNIDNLKEARVAEIFAV